MINPSLPTPERLRIDTTADGFSFSWRWFKLSHVFMLFFSILWFGFLFAWYAGVGSLQESNDPISTLFLFLPLVHVGVGFLLLYAAVCGFINSTEIRLESEQMRIRHFPLPWLGKRSLPKSEIKQLYVRQRARRTKHGIQISYELYALNHENRALKLIKGLDADECRYLEQALEKHLGIQNKEVPGEYRG